MSGRLIDDDGNEWQIVAAGPATGWTVNRDGTVTHFTEEDRVREEHTETLHSSPVRDLFAPWVWDAIEDTIDPRGEDGGAGDP